MNKKQALQLSSCILEAISKWVEKECPEATTNDILATLEALLVSMKFTKAIGELGIDDEEIEHELFMALMKGLM